MKILDNKNYFYRVTHIPTGLAVFIQDDRTQHTNRAKALAVREQNHMLIYSLPINRFLKKDCLQLKSQKIKKIYTVKEKNKWLQGIDPIKSELITSLNPVSQVFFLKIASKISSNIPNNRS